jgi:competence protein ComEC
LFRNREPPNGSVVKALANPELWPNGAARAPAIEPLRFRRAPLLAAAVCFGLGVCLAQPSSHFRPTIALLAAVLALTALTALSLRRAPNLLLLPLLSLWIVAGFWSAEIEPAAPSQAALEQYADGLSRMLRGHVVRVRELPPRAAADPDADADAAEWEEAEGPPILSFDLDLTAIEEVTPDRSRMLPASGGVRVTVIGMGTGAGIGDANSAPALYCGDLVEVPARLRAPERYRDPGAWQYADYLAAQGIGAQASVPSSVLSSVLSSASASHPDISPDRSGVSQRSLRCGLYRAQTWAARSLTGFVLSPANRALPRLLRLTPDDAGMLNAMLLGDRDRLNHALRLGFERTGSFHLFVVSGMHVALLAGGLFWLFRRLRLHPIAATLATIALATAYALLTGFGAPVQRALLMSSIFLLARLLSRTRNAANGLGAALLGVLILSPASLFESGFQMTFLAILAIAGIALPLGEWSFLAYAHAARNLDGIWNDRTLPPHLAQFRIALRIWSEHLEALASTLPGSLAKPAARHLRNLPAACVRGFLWTLELMLIGIVAELVMTLPMAVYFHRATFYGLPANMFSIPLVAVLAPLAILTFLLSLVSTWLAIVPGAATALLLHGITAVIAQVSHLRGADWRVPAPPLSIALIALLGWAFCCWAVRRPQRRHGARWTFAAAALLPLLATLILWPWPAITTPNTLEVTAIDVGQGDSLLLVSPAGRTMLIDAGGPVGRSGATALSANTQAAWDTGEDVVSPYLWSRRLRRLDIVALTHAHSDHMGGMPAILRNFRPRELWVSIDPGSAAYTALLHQAAELNIPVRHLHAGDILSNWERPGDDSKDSIAIHVLAPALGYVNHGHPVNNDSLVLHLRYGQASALLEGDAEAPSEHAMLAGGAITPVTLLKVGHHGSRTSTTPAFFAATAPRDAVISVGRHNSFGHPRGEVIARIAQARTRLYRTDEFGLTRFFLTADGSITESDIQQEPQPPSLWPW